MILKFKDPQKHPYTPLRDPKDILHELSGRILAKSIKKLQKQNCQCISLILKHIFLYEDM